MMDLGLGQFIGPSRRNVILKGIVSKEVAVAHLSSFKTKNSLFFSSTLDARLLLIDRNYLKNYSSYNKYENIF